MKRAYMEKLAFGMTLLFILFIIFLLGGIYFYFTSPVGPNREITFEVKEGDTYSTIAKSLKQKNLIKSETFYKIYLKIKKVSQLSNGVYTLNSNMSLNEILKVFSSKNRKKVLRITFKEGRNMRYIISKIIENFPISEDQILALLRDPNYLEKIKREYSFIGEEIKNEDLYYSLEGYLYPDTYDFLESATAEDIFKKMLDNTNRKLSPYIKSIETSGYTVHQILTLASITELEASTLEDRKNVSSVFFNRLTHNMALGSDVTTYYASKVDMGERDLYKSEINAANGYNTRSSSMVGKLPIGPICNPSISSIEAVLTAPSTNYYYFVTDKNKKVYFSKNYKEHDQVVASLKRDNLWYTY